MSDLSNFGNSLGIPTLDASTLVPKLGVNYTPQMAPMVNPVDPTQIAAANAGVAGAMGQNQGLYNAMANQGYGTQQTGLQGQLGVLNQQRALANQFQQQAMGQGPNPAQAQLAQNTGQNVQNQAALMAGQRGAGANAGLMARQIGQQGAGIQQQAVGQAATMGAQQQLAAQQNLMNQQAQMQSGYGNITNTGLNQQGQQINQLGNMNQAALGNQAQLLGAQGQYNQSLAGMQGNVNTTNAQIAQANAGIQSGVVGGLLQGAGALGAAALGGGATAGGGALFGGASTAGMMGTADTGMAALGSDAMTLAPAAAMYSGGLATVHGIYHGGKAPQKLACGGMAEGGMPMKSGGSVPGKPKVGGTKDTPKNDTVAAKLSPGEIVIPRSITEGQNPGEAAKAFVEKLLASKGSSGSKQDHDDFKKALQASIGKRKAK